MRIEIHADIHVHTAESGKAPEWAIDLQASINELRSTVMATFDDVIAKVTALSDVEDGVIALLTDISARLKAAGQDQAKLDALAASIDAQSTKMSEAVTANTPAA